MPVPARIRTWAPGTGLALSSFLALLLLWCLLAYSGAVKELFLPRPHRVLLSFGEMHREGILWQYTWDSTYRVMVGWAMAVALAVPWLWLLRGRPRQRRELIEGVAIVAVVAASVAGVWYIRAARHRGNPVYPFFEELRAAAPAGPVVSRPPSRAAPAGQRA